MKFTASFALFLALIYPAFAETSAGGPEFTSIRAVTANISSGSHQNYDNGEGLRILKGLKADVVMIQEFNFKSNSPLDLEEFILTGFEKGFQFFRESESSDQIPNGIISRFPILTSGEWEDANMPNRDFAWAQMDIPGDRDLWAISVHLSASKADVRQKEATALRELILQNIPANDYVLLGGDFNLQGKDREDPTLEILRDVVFETAAPTDAAGNASTNMKRKKHYDWILNDADLAQYQVPTEFKSEAEEASVSLVNSFPNGLVFESNTFPRLHLVAPIQAEDSHANGMQHLAVVKDYAVPAPAGQETPNRHEPQVSTNSDLISIFLRTILFR